MSDIATTVTDAITPWIGVIILGLMLVIGASFGAKILKKLDSL